MFKLLREVSWPSDFAVLERGSMYIHESTHSFSPFSIHRSMVGRWRSLVRSSLGIAALSIASPVQRHQMLEITASLAPEDAALARDRNYIRDLVARTREDGYASSVGQSEQGISAIAAPIRARSPLIGSINIVFFSSAMTPATAAKRYLSSLKATAEEIERRWQRAPEKRVLAS